MNGTTTLFERNTPRDTTPETKAAADRAAHKMQSLVVSDQRQSDEAACPPPDAGPADDAMLRRLDATRTAALRWLARTER